MMGQFKNKLGKVEKVNLKDSKIYVEGVQLQKRDGTKAYYPIDPSNVQILELELSDKKRKKILERKQNVKKSS
jgi:large subunit ribosomal protein L24